MKVLTAIVCAFLVLGASASTQPCHTLCMAGADMCQQNGEAYNCNSGYQLNSQNSCKQCDTALGGKYFDSHGDGNCGSCTANCATCHATDRTLCAACQTGFFGSGTKTCTACTTNCNTCTDATQCSANGCKTGYYRKADGKCANCPTLTNCQSTCTDAAGAAGTCTTCTVNDQPFFPVADNKSCKQCPANCQTCTGAGDKADECNTCKAGYWLDAANKKMCNSCLSNCATCSEAEGKANTCGTCKAGYYKAADSKSCPACTANCATCTAANVCPANSCKAGYYVQANKCASCAVANCATCTDANGATQCGACKDGYYKSADSTKCIACNVGNCKTCSNANGYYKCDTCKDGFQPGTNGLSCVACAIATNAKPQNHIYDANAAWTCTDCKVAGCATCAASTNLFGNKQPAEAAQCTTCKVGYAAMQNPTTQCKQCTGNCNQCNTDKAAATPKCDTNQCKTGYFRKAADGTCTTCTVANCAACIDTDGAANKCTTCKTGFFLKTGGLSCDACPTGTNCDSSSCGAVDGNAAECNKCTTATPAYYLVANKKSCKQCPANCATCTGAGDNADQCNTCNGGYWKSDDAKTCTKCLSNCAACSNAEGKAGTCGTCAARHYKAADSKSCNACTANCAACTEANKCTAGQCDTGFYLTDTSTCSACGSNCAICDTAQGKAGTCGTCKTGYYLTADNKCSACISNCKSCTTDDGRNSRCSVCADSYALKDSLKKSCVVCDKHCQTCAGAAAQGATPDYRCAVNGCDERNHWRRSNVDGRCKYCQFSTVPSGPNKGKSVASPYTGIEINTSNQVWNAATGQCTTCDPNASGAIDTGALNAAGVAAPRGAAVTGCATATTPNACKAGYLPLATHCAKPCQTATLGWAWGKQASGSGKCFTCGSNVGTAKTGEPTSCVTETEAKRCVSNYHIQGSGAGICCHDTKDEDAAQGKFAVASLLVAGLVSASAAFSL